MNNKGISLLELLAATALLVIVTTSIALLLPRAVKSASSTRGQDTARIKASGKIQELKEIPYSVVPAHQDKNTSPTNPFPTLDPTCDCSQLAPDQLNVESITYDNAVTFERRLCVNVVGADLKTPSCILPDGSNDTGFKLIRVSVKYFPTNAPTQVTNDAPFVQMTSVISR